MPVIGGLSAVPYYRPVGQIQKPAPERTSLDPVPRRLSVADLPSLTDGREVLCSVIAPYSVERNLHLHGPERRTATVGQICPDGPGRLEQPPINERCPYQLHRITPLTSGAFRSGALFSAVGMEYITASSIVPMKSSSSSSGEELQILFSDGVERI